MQNLEKSPERSENTANGYELTSTNRILFTDKNYEFLTHVLFDLNYIDLFIIEEVENGRDPIDLSLKDTIKVYK